LKNSHNLRKIITALHLCTNQTTVLAKINMKLLFNLLLCFIFLFYRIEGFLHSSRMTLTPAVTRHSMSELTTGDLEGIEITKVSGVLSDSSPIQKYRIEANLKVFLVFYSNNIERLNFSHLFLEISTE
jgi:hypothetical protein